MKQETTRHGLLSLIREGREITFGQQLRLTAILSLPAIVAQLSTIIMQYIDAAMVGSLGAEASASIGLMATSTWLLWGLCSAASMGFSVQVANRIGAKDQAGAQAVLKQSLLPTLIFSLALCLTGISISGALPFWLGAKPDIAEDASAYFLIFAASLPILQLTSLSGAMLRCSGNTLFPGIVNVGMCVLDVVFNALLIFPSRIVAVYGLTVCVPGAGMGVAGAALGTALAELVAAAVMFAYLCLYNKDLNLRKVASAHHIANAEFSHLISMRRAAKIAAPIGTEHFLLCAAQIITTIIVAPLGTVAIAANAFAVTVESLCYMPGHGVAEAATTLVGQSLGAQRQRLAISFANITVVAGILVMTFMGVLMYLFAPFMMCIITPVHEIVDAGVEILRIEAFAEPMFAASIVAYSVFVGAGDTLMPCCMNLGSIWVVRLSLAALLAPIMGLKGVWIAMATELCFRGIIFLWRLRTDHWINANKKMFASAA